MMEISSGKAVSLQSGHQPRFLVGLDANKSSSPGVGDTYSATDTEKSYFCYVAGTWSEVSSLFSMNAYDEIYTNHLGSTDNFIQTAVTGGGTATPDATNHEIDLAVGTAANDTASYDSKKTWQLDTKILILNMKINNINYGNGANNNILIGFLDLWNGVPFPGYGVFFRCVNSAWQTYARNAANTSNDNMTSPVSGDVLTIVVSSTKVRFYINKVIIKTYTANIPTGIDLHAGAAVLTRAVVVAGCSISVDWINIMKVL